MSDATPLPYVSREWPGIGGAIKLEPARFRVEEIPLYAPSGVGEHVYVEVTRSGRSTPEVAHALARTFGVAMRDIGFAGLKDKEAHTTQVFSLPLATAVPEDVAREITSALGISVAWARRHTNKLKRGHSLGNRFRIEVNGVAPERLTDARAIAQALALRGVPNFFGAQRAGSRGRNVVRGRELLEAGGERRGAQRAWAGRLLLGAFQASLFNAWLAERMERGAFAELALGDVAKKTATGGLFDVLDLSLEAPRFAAREITYTGPIFGSRMRWATGVAGEIERAVLVGSGVDEASFRSAGLKGSRRAGRIAVDDLEIESIADGLAFSFSLPKGSYATVLLREFMKTDDDRILLGDDAE